MRGLSGPLCRGVGMYKLTTERWIWVQDTPSAINPGTNNYKNVFTCLADAGMEEGLQGSSSRNGGCLEHTVLSDINTA